MRALTPRRPLEYSLGVVISAAFIILNALSVGPFSFDNVEVWGFVTGAWSVWLLVRNDLLTWPMGIANGAIFVWLFAHDRLWADATVNSWYVVAGLWGWWFWTRSASAKRSSRPVTHIGWREASLIAVAIAGLTWWMYGHLQGLQDPNPFWDGISACISLAAFYMQGRKQLENWYLWIAVDVIYVPLYFVRSLPLTGVLYAIFLTMSVYGLVEWVRLRRGEQDGIDAGSAGTGRVAHVPIGTDMDGVGADRVPA